MVTSGCGLVPDGSSQSLGDGLGFNDLHFGELDSGIRGSGALALLVTTLQ